MEYDLIIIGGGISGITAAVSAYEEGVKNILIIDREDQLGGILNECIHVGFGEKYLNEKVTGPELVAHFTNKIYEYDIDLKLNTDVIDISKDKVITYINSEEGMVDIKGKTLLIATGCREKYTGSIEIQTKNLTGLFTIGAAHRLVNIDGYLPGKEIIISINSKWGLIVARRMYIEGAEIKGCIMENMESFWDEECEEIARSIELPIYSNCIVQNVIGKERIEGINIFNLNTKDVQRIDGDSLLLSVKYLPETILCRKLGIDIDQNTLTPIVNNYRCEESGLFFCGSILYGERMSSMKAVDGYEAGKIIGEYFTKYLS